LCSCFTSLPMSKISQKRIIRYVVAPRCDAMRCLASVRLNHV
jgi:hypothetical protein